MRHYSCPVKNCFSSFILPFFSLIIPLSSTHAADITPEAMVGSGSCTVTGNDAACWQAAINAAHDSTTNKFGNVAGSSGKQYLINDTIVICNGVDGVIDGHGALLQWIGAVGKPMFLIVGSNHMRFSNLSIQSYPSQPLDAAFEFASTTANPYSTPICQGSPMPSSKNSIDHVTAEGIDINGLNYGVRFSNRYNYDANNDMSTITDSIFYNVTKAAISIEHSQSHQHRLISVSGYGAPGNSGCFVDARTGFIASIGGFQGGWGNANFCVDGAYGTFDITESNSEGSKRLLSAGNVGDATGFPVSVNIQGGRFAVDGLNSDGKLINFNRLGPLTVRGLHIDGTPPTGVKPAISMQPSQLAHSPPIAASAIIEGVSYFTPGSNGWSTLVVKKFVNFFTQGNLCIDSGGYAVACLAPQRPN